MENLRLQIIGFLKSAWRHRWIALATAWLICGLGWAGVTMIPNQYELTARIFVDADAVLTPLLRGLAAETAPASQLEILQRTLLSRPNVEKLISKTDLDLQAVTSSDRERLVAQLTKQLVITPQAKNLFTITYRNPDAKLAYNVTQSLLTIFIEQATGSNRADMENARLFLQRQIASYETQLRELERRRAEFKSKYHDVLPGETGGPNGLVAARLALEALNGDLADATQRRNSLKQELASTPPLVVLEPGGGGFGPGAPGGPGRLAQAQRELSELKLKYTDAHPDVISLKKLIEEIKSSPGGGAAPAPPAANAPQADRGAGYTRARSAPNPVYDQLKVRLIDADALVNSLQRKAELAKSNVARLETVVRSEPGIEAQFQNLDRDYNVLRKNYEELLARRELANIAQAADTQADKVRLQIVDPPQVSRLPVSPNRVLLISGVFLAGLGASTTLAFLIGQFDRSFRTTDDLRSLGLPVIGGISMLINSARPKRMVGTLVLCSGFLMLGVVYGGLMARALRALAAI